MPRRTVFHSFDAHVAYVENFMERPELLLCLVLFDGDQARAICPLEQRIDRSLRLPIRVWGTPWHPHWPLSDAICPEDDARRAMLPLLVEHLQHRSNRAHMLVLGPFLEPSVLLDGLTDLTGASHSSHVGMQPFVFDCEQPFEELMARLPRHFRKELRRCGRRLASLEGVRFESVDADGDIERAFEEFLDLESSGWKGRTGSGTAIKLNPRYVAFYRALARDLDAGDGCEINLLRAEGRCIAGEFCLRTGREYAALKIGYDETYSSLGPGQLLAARTLERCCMDPRIARYNQLSDAAWLRVWRAGSESTRQIHIALGRLGRPLAAALDFRFGYGRAVVRRARRQAKRIIRPHHLLHCRDGDCLCDSRDSSRKMGRLAARSVPSLFRC